MTTTNYFYGQTLLHDSYNYFLQQKEIAFPPYAQALVPSGRYLGVVKTGERQNHKTMKVQITVISQRRSRADLENLLDILLAGLMLRQQSLSLHNLDGRFWIADATEAQVQFVSMIRAVVTITFVATQPFAVVPSPGAQNSFIGAQETYTYGPTNFTTSQVNGQWQTPVFSVQGAGNTNAYPSIIVQNYLPLGTAQLSAALGVGSHTSFTVYSPGIPFAWNAPGIVILYQNYGNFTLVPLSGNNAAGATTINTASFTVPGPNPIPQFTTAGVIPTTTLSSSLTSGNPYTSLSCAAMPYACGAGCTATLNDFAGHTQTVTMPFGCAAGATTLTVNSFTANFSYPNSTTYIIPNQTATSVTFTQLTSGLQLYIPASAGLAFATLDKLFLTGRGTSGGPPNPVQDSSSVIGDTFSGSIPYLTPGMTQFQIALSLAVIQPYLQVTINWSPLWLS